MYKVMVEERTDETSSGSYGHAEFDDLKKAQREAAAARFAYPNGTAWVEDNQGNIIPPSSMKRVEIPTADWHMALATAVKEADDKTTIVVRSEAQKQLAFSAADRLNKQVNVEVAG